MESIYVLQLENGKYYVGKSINVPARYKQHKDGVGCAWTIKHKPVKIVEVRRLKDEYDENNTTKTYMKKYGISNVRGGAYCQVELPDITKIHLERELNCTSDNCYICGQPGHYAKSCLQSWCCEFCPRKFTSYQQCLTHEDECQGQLGCCYRCGRYGHFEMNCYARTHVNGTYIDDSSDDE